MKTTTLSWRPDTGWSRPLADISFPVHLILYFGSRDILSLDNSPWKALRQAFPQAICAGCSSSGEIKDMTVTDDHLVAVVVSLEKSCVQSAAITVSGPADSLEAGRKLGAQLPAPGLRHVLILSDGLLVNGTTLTAGLRETLPPGVLASGGLAGDGARFQKTLVGLGDHVVPGQVVALGFYGEHLHAKPGCAGGWEAFGPIRHITKSTGNTLYTLDGQPALAVYKRYLGALAEKLPSSGLLFPIELLATRDAKEGLVRTILAVDEEKQSLTFAGDLPESQYARLMKASCDALVDGAETASELALPEKREHDRLAVIVSCVGRKLVMGQRIEEEVEAAVNRLGSRVGAIGFYSYGEISPYGLVHSCDLHNQTMTLTIFEEAA
jgi:hypothetical protein